MAPMRRSRSRATADNAPTNADAVRALLVESGLWTALRTRPFSKVPSPATTPHAIFVTAIDTRPHAPAVDVVLAERTEDFHAGLLAVAKLCPGTTYVCKAAGSRVTAPSAERIVVEEFAGPHPAGTPGLHIHVLDPVRHGKTVWHIGYQDVAAIGRLLTTGDARRRARGLARRSGCCAATPACARASARRWTR